MSSRCRSRALDVIAEAMIRSVIVRLLNQFTEETRE